MKIIKTPLAKVKKYIALLISKKSLNVQVHLNTFTQNIQWTYGLLHIFYNEHLEFATLFTVNKQFLLHNFIFSKVEKIRETFQVSRKLIFLLEFYSTCRLWCKVIQYATSIFHQRLLIHIQEGNEYHHLISSYIVPYKITFKLYLFNISLKMIIFKVTMKFISKSCFYFSSLLACWLFNN